MSDTGLVVLLVVGVTISVALKGTGFGRSEGAVQELGPLKVGGPAPDAALQTMSGGELSLALLRGRAVLLEFGATWCGPCRAMLRPMRDLQARNASRPPDVISVDVGESVDVVRRHYATHKYGGIRIALDPTGAVSERYGVRAFPTLVVVDRGGIVRMINVGSIWNIEPVQHVVEELAGP